MLRGLNFEILSDPFQLFATRHLLHKRLYFPLRHRVSFSHLEVEIEEFQDSNSDFEGSIGD